MTTEKKGEEVVAPKKTRNRGPNKPKVEEVSVDQSSKVVSPISEVIEVKEKPEFARPSKNMNEATTYKVFLGGQEQWFTKLQINVGLQRGLDIKIPEGSPFDSPLDSRCTNCGG
jgi:hypothetical protein